MPEGQNRAEGEQAGSRAEQGPERRGNISVSQLQTPHRPHRQNGPLHGIAGPRGSLGTQSKVMRKGSHPVGQESVGRMMECGGHSHATPALADHPSSMEAPGLHRGPLGLLHFLSWCCLFPSPNYLHVLMQFSPHSCQCLISLWPIVLIRLKVQHNVPHRWKEGPVGEMARELFPVLSQA